MRVLDVPLEVVMAVLEVDVVLLEDGSPLEGCSCDGGQHCAARFHVEHMTRTMLSLASRAMAEFAVQWLFTANLVLHLAAMAAGVVQSIEVLVLLMDSVGCTLLPLVLALCTGTGLVRSWMIPCISVALLLLDLVWCV